MMMNVIAFSGITFSAAQHKGREWKKSLKLFFVVATMDPFCEHTREHFPPVNNSEKTISQTEERKNKG